MSDDRWNQDNAWAEESRWSRSDEAEQHWAEDVRSGAAYHMQGQSASVPQSGLGIASLILSILAGAVMVVPLTLAILLLDPNLQEDDPRVMALGCALISGLLLAALAGLLGVIGLFQPDRGKTCAVLGLLFAAAEIVGLLGLIAIGMLVG